MTYFVKLFVWLPFHISVASAVRISERHWAGNSSKLPRFSKHTLAASVVPILNPFLLKENQYISLSVLVHLIYFPYSTDGFDALKKSHHGEEWHYYISVKIGVFFSSSVSLKIAYSSSWGYWILIVLFDHNFLPWTQTVLLG